MLEGAFDEADVEQAARDGLSLVVHEARQLDWLEAMSAPEAIDVFLKFNSGMNRLGFRHDAFRDAFARLARLASVRQVMLMTHFANADLAGGADEALARFQAAAAGLPATYSLANSAATRLLPGTHGHANRPGVKLYGGTPPGDGGARTVGPRPTHEPGSGWIAVL